jgi:hypothetical protein
MEPRCCMGASRLTTRPCSSGFAIRSFSLRENVCDALRITSAVALRAQTSFAVPVRRRFARAGHGPVAKTSDQARWSAKESNIPVPYKLSVSGARIDYFPGEFKLHSI